jgi:hypothetical protein
MNQFFKIVSNSSYFADRIFLRQIHFFFLISYVKWTHLCSWMQQNLFDAMQIDHTLLLIHFFLLLKMIFVTFYTMLTGAREKKYCAQVENSWKHFVREREKISRHLFSQNPCMVRVVSFLVLSYVILHLPSERYKREIGALQRINFHLKNPH